MPYGAAADSLEMPASQPQRVAISWAFRITLFLSFLAKIAIFSTIPFNTASIYIGIGLIIFDICLVVLLRWYIKRIELEDENQQLSNMSSRETVTSPSVNGPPMMMPPAYEDTMRVYNISGQHHNADYPNNQHTHININMRNNVFAEMGQVNSADLVLMGPVIANRTLPPSSSQIQDETMEQPPSYEDAIKQIT